MSMASNRSLSGLVVSLFGALALLVAVVFVLELVSLVSLRDDTTSGRRTTDLLTTSYNAELSVLDLETGLRGYLLTQDQRFLAPYNSARTALARDLPALARLASGPLAKHRVTALSGAIASYIHNYAIPLIATGGRLNDKQAAVLTSRGKQLVDGLRGQFAPIDSAALAARQARRNMLSSQTTVTIVVGAIGFAITALLLVLVGAYMLRAILRPIRDVAEALEKRRQGALRVHVPERGRGEVVQLGRSFNAMVDVLEQRTTELSDANAQLKHAVTVAEEASRMKSDFLANMSHEIRTPLNGVVGMVTLLAATPLSKEQREYVDMAHVSSDTLIHVVSDILDVSKIEAGRLEIEQQDFDLHDLIGATRDMLSQAAESKGLKVVVDIGADVPQAVRGDRLRVGQVLGNLLANAVKFTAAGEVALRASVLERTVVAAVVRFEVRDTGIGIAADRLATLFDPFMQADLSTTRQYGGTGLGLTISRDLTRLMGGTISAQSELGKGSTFKVSIPFAPALGALAPPVPAVELRGLRILVVDDNAANRRIIEAYVGSWGMRSNAARDAAHALTQLIGAADEGAPYDVALLDFNMPGETGVELARRISASPRLRSTRLILLSSTGTSLAELESNGIRLSVTKPISQSSLLEAIAAAMHAGPPEPGSVPPSEPGSVPPSAAEPELTCPPEPEPAPARILIAEDNLVNRMYVERLLARMGHTVASAVDGREVLVRYEAGDYDAILMDCQMPELDGYDTTREIRRREAASGRARIPIVAMTAAASEDIRRKCLDAGMDDYLTKPLGDGELQQVLAVWLPEASPIGPAAALDESRIARLRAVFPGEEATTMLVRIAAEVMNELARLEDGLAAGDHAAVATAAHSIRGSAQMIGASRLSDAATEVELIAGERPAASDEQVSGGVAALREAWEHTRRGIEAQVEADRRGYHPGEATD